MTILKKILKTLLVILLILLPLLGGALLSRYSPYTDGNGMKNFVFVYSLFVIAVASILFYLTNKFRQTLVQPVLPGILLFFVGCVMIGIAGLAAAPDLTIKMLEYPEREHCRYILLFIGAIFFGLYFINLFINNSLQLRGTFKWIMIGIFALAMVELLWEFTHHYRYPEGLKEWIAKGNKAEEFNKNYDDWKMITTGAIGRFFIYILMLLLSLRLYKIRRIAIWNPLLNTLLCILGIISSIAFFLYGAYNIETPKELGFLMLFFIPGLPFLIIYWIGVALLTKTNNFKTVAPNP